MSQQGRIAFLGFPDLTTDALTAIETAANSSAGQPAWKVTGSFADLREAAAAITTIREREVIGEGSMLYIADGQPDSICQTAARLEAVGVMVCPRWAPFDDFWVDVDSAVKGWLGGKPWPEKPSPLDALLFGKTPGAARESAAPAPAADPLGALLEAPAPASPPPVAAPIVEPTPAVPAPAQPEQVAPAEASSAAPTPQEEPAAAQVQPVETMANVEPDQKFPEPPEEIRLVLPSDTITPVAAAAESAPNPLLAGALPPMTAVPAQESPAFLAPGPDAPASGPTQTLPEAQPTVPADTEQHDGCAFFYTGTHGGSGKTTLCYIGAHTTAQAFKEAGRKTPVYLLEGDFGNPKLEQRLHLKAENTSIAYVRYLEWLSKNELVAEPSHLARMRAEAIQRATWTDPTTGLHVIAAPFDTRKGSSDHIQTAIIELARYLLNQGAFVFIDSGTAGKVDDKPADRELARMASHIFVATSAGERNAEGEWQDGHLADMTRMTTTFSSSETHGGWGLDRTKITTFFNKTSLASYEERRFDTGQIAVSGHLPYTATFEDAWIGNKQQSGAFLRAVIHTGRALASITGLEELKVLEAVPVPEIEGETKAPAEPRKRKRFRGR